MDILCNDAARVSHSWQQNGCPQRVLVALSGGCDSVALFAILRALSSQHLTQLAAVHVNHGIRETAERDAQFARKLCEKYGVPFFLEKAELRSPSENDAREARYAAFARVYQKWGAQALALAHHRSDQAETVLLHLFRGSGSRGLCGMAEFHSLSIRGTDMNLWRPCLQLSKEELKAIATQSGDAWCEDETNASDAYLRNFLRQRILPAIGKRMPGAEDAIVRTADILQKENQWMDQEAQLFLSRHAHLHQPVKWIKKDAFVALHEGMRRRVMLHFLPESVNYDMICAAANVQDGETVNLTENRRILCLENGIYLMDPLQQKPAILPLQPAPSCGKRGNGITCQSIPERVYHGCWLRYRREGDVIRPFGMEGTKKLSDYLADKKVPQLLRDYLPLLCKENRVLWVIGVGAAEETRCHGNQDELMLTYMGPLLYQHEIRKEK